MPIEIGESTFDKEVLRSDVPVLVYFYLPSCAKCVVMMSAAEGMERGHKKKLKLAKINIARTQGLARELNVKSAPTFIVYKKGREMERFYGDNLTMGNLEDMLQKIQ